MEKLDWKELMNPKRDSASDDKSSQFQAIQVRLAEMYTRIFPDPLAPRTIVVVPSLTLPISELEKIDGVHHYEERMLCLKIR